MGTPFLFALGREFVCQFSQVSPGIKSGVVIVGPGDFEGVVAGVFHGGDGDVIADFVDIVDADAGEFINAVGAGAAAT